MTDTLLVACRKLVSAYQLEQQANGYNPKEHLPCAIHRVATTEIPVYYPITLLNDEEGFAYLHYSADLHRNRCENYRRMVEEMKALLSRSE